MTEMIHFSDGRDIFDGVLRWSKMFDGEMDHLVIPNTRS